MRCFKNILCLLLCLTRCLLYSQPVCQLTSYYEVSNNEPIHHLMGMLQDKNGMIWITTWGGIYSFDGISFISHQSTNDSVRTRKMPRGIVPSPTGDQWQPAGTNLDFSIPDPWGTTWHMHRDGQLYYSDSGEHEIPYPDFPAFEGYRGCFADHQGNLWVMCYYSLHKIVFLHRRLQPLPEGDNQVVRCMHKFRNGQYWLCQRNTGRIQVFDSSDRLSGYLTPDGHIISEPVSFNASVYSILETDEGTIWLGTRNAGLFRLKPQSDETFSVEQYISSHPERYSIYAMAYDRFHCLWMASLDSGLLCLTDKDMQTRRPPRSLPMYDYRHFPKAHSLSLYRDTLTVATSQGVVIADISPADPEKTIFHYHVHEPERPASLSSSLCDYVYTDSLGRFFVCTEDGSLNRCLSNSLMNNKLVFDHLGNDGLSDISYCVITDGHDIWMTSLYSLSRIQNVEDGNSLISFFGTRYLGEKTRFIEIPPLKISEERWLVSTSRGTKVLQPRKMDISRYNPFLRVVSLDIPGEKELHYPAIPDTILIRPGQRSFKIEFAALDYSHPQNIKYAYRMKDIDTNWVYLRNKPSVSFVNIVPGKHLLEIRSTNSDGIWCDNICRTTINVKARFSETIWMTLLLALIVIILFNVILQIYLYIRNIQKQHKEILSAYLSVIGKQKVNQVLIEQSLKIDINEEENSFIQNFTRFINENLGNPDLSVETIAKEMAVSYSTLTRHTKSLMGITPGEFLAKARIRKASILLTRQQNLTISEIAYQCGFNDSKYFARCFKSENGISPSDYRSLNKETVSQKETM